MSGYEKEDSLPHAVLSVVAVETDTSVAFPMQSFAVAAHDSAVAAGDLIAVSFVLL